MRSSLWAIIFSLICTPCTLANEKPEQPAGTRPFLMGFTAFPPDFTPQAILSTRKFMKENADLIAHHIEGVPWTEALSGAPFPAAFMKEWEDKKLATPANGRVYLAISPGRGELKPAEKAPGIPKELKGKSYDDPMVMKA